MSYKKEDSSIPMPCQSIPVDVDAPASAFPGFRVPSYTMVPDELFDQLMPDLSGSALKVLLYIVRRTFGFKKQSDTISLTQLCCGITTRDGRALYTHCCGHRRCGGRIAALRRAWSPEASYRGAGVAVL